MNDPADNGDASNAAKDAASDGFSDAAPGWAGWTEIATIGQRIGARVIDWILLFMASFVILVFGDSRVGFLVWMAIVAAYEVGSVLRTGQTIGKRILAIAVVNHRTGQVPSLRQAILRVVPVLLVMAVVPGQLFPLVILFLYFTAAFSGDHYRGLLDRLAGTAVVKAPSG